MSSSTIQRPHRAPSRRRTSLNLLAAATVPVLAIVTACGGDAEGSNGEGNNGNSNSSDSQAGAEAAGLEVNTGPDQDRVRTEPNQEAIDALPEEFAEKDTFVVSVSPYVAPLSFLADDEQTPIGNETDIAQLVADSLDKELVLEVRAWADWPLALESGAVDAVISNVTVTEERKDLYDFSSYRNDELGWLTRADSDIEEINEAADVAGLSVSVGSGTNQEKILLAWDEENQHNGLDPVEVEYFESHGDVLLALSSGRLDVHVGPNATSSYSARVNPDQYRVVGTLNGGWPDTAQIAVATIKDGELAEPITIALQGTFDDGTYQEVLERWGLEAEAIEQPETNPPGLPRE